MMPRVADSVLNAPRLRSIPPLYRVQYAISLAYNQPMRQLLPLFFTVFLAELGDKTQLATLLFATDRSVGKLQVFLAASSALVLSTLLAVMVGEGLTRVISPHTLKVVAGFAFIGVGVWTLWSAAH
jgi:putative Ca2+/H+ antiporter (TMEM165/GDT1 family)